MVATPKLKRRRRGRDGYLALEEYLDGRSGVIQPLKGISMSRRLTINNRGMDRGGELTLTREELQDLGNGTRRLFLKNTRVVYRSRDGANRVRDHTQEGEKKHHHASHRA